MKKNNPTCYYPSSSLSMETTTLSQSLFKLTSIYGQNLGFLTKKIILHLDIKTESTEQPKEKKERKKRWKEGLVLFL